MVLDNGTAVTDLSSLVNSITTVAIPAFIALGIAIMNAVNHFAHSKRTDNLAEKTQEYGADIKAILAKQAPNIDTAIGIGSQLSPAISNQIVANHPSVVALQTKMSNIESQLVTIISFLNTLQSPTLPPAATATTKTEVVSKDDKQ